MKLRPRSPIPLLLMPEALWRFIKRLFLFTIQPPYEPGMLEGGIKKCHQQNIRVIVRFDFSRVHKNIFDKHPDWGYSSPAGERMINTDMYLVSINAFYVQEVAFKIIEEVIGLYLVDGTFLNMPGYQTWNPYETNTRGLIKTTMIRRPFLNIAAN